MAGRHAAPVGERTERSPETTGHEVVPTPTAAAGRSLPAEGAVVPDAFTSRRARREAERLVASVEAPVLDRPVEVPTRSAAADRPVAVDARPAAVAAAAPALRTLGAPVPAAPVAAAPRTQHHPVSLKRLALLLAPALAITSGIALASPANADPLPRPVVSSTQQSGQRFTVASDVRVPVVQENGTTVVSLPSLVVSGGATVDQAQTALRSALSAGGPRAEVLEVALTYLGDTYVEGGASHQGIDCSGLTMVAYQAVGIELVHYVPTQDAAATTIPESEALPGDLVVYDDEDHVGLFLGDGLVLQAPHPGEPVDIIPMFSAAHHFARVLPA